MLIIYEFKILVCGGRDFKDEDLVFAYLFAICKRIRKGLSKSVPIIIIEGGATGADFFAGNFAKKFKYYFNIHHIREPANWDKYKKKAGMTRNRKMLEYNPKLCVAFEGENGTLDMVGLCKSNGIKTIKVKW